MLWSNEWTREHCQGARDDHVFACGQNHNLPSHDYNAQRGHIWAVNWTTVEGVFGELAMKKVAYTYSLMCDEPIICESCSVLFV